MQKLLENKVIVISGGTKGIGKGVAIEAAKQGAKVVIGGRDKEAGHKIVAEIEENGGNALFVSVDLLHVEECINLFDRAVEKYGKIDGYVNYAGVTDIASVVDCDEATFDHVFNINIKGAFFCIQSAVKYMKEKGGSIVVFGSPHDDRGEKDRAVYACSKAALSGLVTHIAKYYGENQIRINYITMGWTPTEGELALRKKQGMNEDELRKLAAGMIPMGRMQEVEDHIPAVMYLLSDYSSMVTGSNIRITGGLYF